MVDKRRLLKALCKIFLLALVMIAFIVSINGFFSAELVVDKIHHGFILTFLFILLYCDGNNKRGGGNVTLSS